MERLKEFSNYAYAQSSDAIFYVSTHGEQVAGLIVLALVGVLLITAAKAWKNGEGTRQMAKTLWLEEQRMMSDQIGNLLLRLHVKDKLSAERVYYWQKKFALAGDLTDLLPRKGPRQLKEHLKRKRYSSKPEMIAALQESIEPAPIPGPKPGEDQPTTKEKANVVNLFQSGSAAA